ncbi:MAG: hypothetical protein GXO24_06400 [Chlorobi bacterium]|nr:hypothetical protein [Chlorobiota bacterium]
MDKLQLTGGARIGRMNASFPFATLSADKEKLELDVSLLGNYVFLPSDIVSIEPYRVVPFLGEGIKINHRVADYNPKIIFWSFKRPEEVIEQIKAAGFRWDDAPEHMEKIEIRRKQQQGGFPLKKFVVISLIVIWNILLLPDILKLFLHDAPDVFPVRGIMEASGFLFLFSLLSLISPGFRDLILKEGRELKDIKKMALFILFISGMMFLQSYILMKVTR